MHLHQLKYFVSIVETGSVTKAAERCYISQPSISQQLSKLEESVGKKLFSRVKGKLILTDDPKLEVLEGSRAGDCLQTIISPNGDMTFPELLDKGSETFTALDRLGPIRRRSCIPAVRQECLKGLC